jgi:hypothetical protein
MVLELTHCLGQDLMTEEHPKDDYYREAAQLLNAAERVGRESGERVNETLAFLTRGMFPCSRLVAGVDHSQVSSSWRLAQWTMLCGRSRVSLP